MASGERRGNREAKKPKAVKPKDPVPASPFANAGKGKPVAGPSGGRKA